MNKRRTPRPARTTRTTQTQQAETATGESETPAPSPVDHHDLAAEAIADGWTREQVVHVLIVRVRRDGSYLAFRKATNRRNSYDAQIQQDMRALSLAAVWLAEGEISGAQLK